LSYLAPLYITGMAIIILLVSLFVLFLFLARKDTVGHMEKVADGIGFVGLVITDGCLCTYRAPPKEVDPRLGWVMCNQIPNKEFRHVLPLMM